MAKVRLGLVGKPNAGKSTLFSAITSRAAEIGSYPFTTIKPNIGLGFIETKCPDTEIGTTCNPREGSCSGGIRQIPIEIIDVPGLIEGASQGKGMGNEFLENVRESEALLLVFDASGKTALDGTPVEERIDPNAEIDMIKGEITKWMVARLSKGWEKFASREEATNQHPAASLLRKLSMSGINEQALLSSLSAGGFPLRLSIWKEEDFTRFSEMFLARFKPLILLGNKVDAADPETIDRIRAKHPDTIFTSGDFELALSRAVQAGLAEVSKRHISPSARASEPQRKALARVQEVISLPYYASPEAIMTDVVRERLERIAVYPVQDESKWTDSQGNVLPDCFMVRKGTTAIDLAFRVHSDIGEGFIRAIDCRRKMVISRDHELKDSDVISIVSRSR